MPVPLLRRATPKTAATTKQSPAGQLPPEVLLMVLAHLRDPADALYGDGIPRADTALAGAPRICRAWAAAATFELYRTVALPDVEACAMFLRTLRARPALGTRVRRVALPLCSASRAAKTKHRATHCPAMDDFSEILRRLPGVRAARVQDLHVSDQALARIDELVIDNGFSACTAVRLGYPQLLHADHCLRNVRELTLLGSPWGMPAPPCGARYSFPSLRVLRLRAIDAPLADMSALLHATRGTLRRLELDGVRAYAGRCSAASIASLADVVAPVAETLEQLRTVGMRHCGGLHALARLESLEVDASHDLSDLGLPPGLRSLKVVARECPDDDEIAGLTPDPWETGRAVWTLLARGSAPRLDRVALHVTPAAPENLRAWRVAALLLQKTCAHVDLRFTLHIAHAHPVSSVVPVNCAVPQKVQSDWTRRGVFEPMRKFLKRTVMV